MKYPVNEVEKIITRIFKKEFNIQKFIPDISYYYHRTCRCNPRVLIPVYQNLYEDKNSILIKEEYTLKLGLYTNEYRRKENNQSVIEMSFGLKSGTNPSIEINVNEQDYLQWVLDYKLSKL